MPFIAVLQRQWQQWRLPLTQLENRPMRVAS